MKAWLIPISLVLLADTAHADQCAWVDGAAAQKAKSILKTSPKFIEYCEPCGDKAPGIPQLAKTVDVNAAGDAYKEVSINGKAIDLAYVFVRTDDLHYRNLAGLAGCPATGVSPSLAIEAETTNGVMITADDDQPPAPGMTAVTTIPAFQLPVAHPPPPTPPQVYVYSTTTHEVAWFALVIAATGGFVTGATLMFVLLALRRRRTMRPRAMDITSPVG